MLREGRQTSGGAVSLYDAPDPDNLVKFFDPVRTKSIFPSSVSMRSFRIWASLAEIRAGVVKLGG